MNSKYCLKRHESGQIAIWFILALAAVLVVVIFAFFPQIPEVAVASVLPVPIATRTVTVAPSETTVPTVASTATSVPTKTATETATMTPTQTETATPTLTETLTVIPTIEVTLPPVGTYRQLFESKSIEDQEQIKSMVLDGDTWNIEDNNGIKHQIVLLHSLVDRDEFTIDGNSFVSGKWAILWIGFYDGAYNFKDNRIFFSISVLGYIPSLNKFAANNPWPAYPSQHVDFIVSSKGEVTEFWSPNLAYSREGNCKWVNNNPDLNRRWRWNDENIIHDPKIEGCPWVKFSKT